LRNFSAAGRGRRKFASPKVKKNLLRLFMKLVEQLARRRLPKLHPWTRKDVIALLRLVGRAVRRRKERTKP
jgi:hypothetical protein